MHNFRYDIISTSRIYFLIDFHHTTGSEGSEAPIKICAWVIHFCLVSFIVACASLCLSSIRHRLCVCPFRMWHCVEQWKTRSLNVRDGLQLKWNPIKCTKATTTRRKKRTKNPMDTTDFGQIHRNKYRKVHNANANGIHVSHLPSLVPFK